MKKAVLTIVVTLSLCGLAFGQSTASNKAVFAYNPNGIAVTTLFNNVSLINAPAAIKTSTNGALLIGLSMECVLWTNNIVTATSGGGKNSVSARATVRAQILVDGQPATPARVVYCERLQALGVTLNTGVLTDTVTVELFQATKEANHFNFFKGPLSPTLHSIQVLVSGDVACTNNAGAAVACPSGTLAGFDTATRVGIGQAVLTVEEYNNTNQ